MVLSAKAEAMEQAGIPGMREIAQRYHGILEAGMERDKFVLVACLIYSKLTPDDFFDRALRRNGCGIFQKENC